MSLRPRAGDVLRRADAGPPELFARAGFFRLGRFLLDAEEVFFATFFFDAFLLACFFVDDFFFVLRADFFAVFFAAFFFDDFFFEDFFFDGFFFDAFFFDAFFAAAFLAGVRRDLLAAFLVVFFLDAFFFEAFFFDAVFFADARVLRFATFFLRAAVFFATFFLVALAFLRCLLAVFFAGIRGSCRLRKGGNYTCLWRTWKRLKTVRIAGCARARARFAGRVFAASCRRPESRAAEHREGPVNAE